ncbi:MAG: hypothetical protein LN563_01535, partial [Rickettsia endosymbiont of Platyusa sonomae]|nr:hypothetical protein [Rickettsia endosymbiont of Platyusa sonomae]
AENILNDKKREANVLKRKGNGLVTAAENILNDKKREANVLKRKSNRDFNLVKTKIQDTKRQTDKILKDVKTKLAAAQSTAITANARKVKASGEGDASVNTVGLEELDEVQRELSEAKEQLTELTSNLSEKDTEITSLNDDIADKETQITALTDTIKDKEQEIVTLTDTIKDKEQEVNTEKYKKEQEIKDLHSTYHEQEKVFKANQEKLVKDLNSEFKAKEKELKDNHKQLVENLNNVLKEKEQAFKKEKNDMQKNLADLTKNNNAHKKAFDESQKNLSRLTQSYQNPTQKVAASKALKADQKGSELVLQEKEKQIIDLKLEHKRELEKHQQELVDTQQAMEKLKQQLVNPDPIGGVVARNDIKRYNNANDLTKSPDMLDQKLVTNNILAQQSSKTSVIPKSSPTTVTDPVKTVGVGIKGVSNSPESVTQKQPVISVIDPTTVKKAATISKPLTPTSNGINTPKRQPSVMLKSLSR